MNKVYQWFIEDFVIFISKAIKLEFYNFQVYKFIAFENTIIM